MNNSQTPVEQNFDETELGLQKPNVENRFLVNYIKSLAFNLARDEINLIWRMLRSDINGNLKITPGTQGILPPNIFSFNVQLGMTLALKANPSRKCFIVYNTSFSGGVKEKQINIQYGPSSGQAIIRIQAGWAFKDTNWSGDVYLQSQNTTCFVTIAEYY